MVKPYTISMYEKYNNGSSVVAGADVLNGSFGVVAAGVFTNATQATHIAAQVGKGDDNYTDFTIPSGADMRVFELEPWTDKELQVSPKHITYDTTENYASISAGTILVANASGNLVISAASATGYAYLEVTKKIEFDGDGVLGQILIGA